MTMSSYRLMFLSRRKRTGFFRESRRLRIDYTPHQRSGKPCDAHELAISVEQQVALQSPLNSESCYAKVHSQNPQSSHRRRRPCPSAGTVEPWSAQKDYSVVRVGAGAAQCPMYIIWYRDSGGPRPGVGCSAGTGAGAESRTGCCRGKSYDQRTIV